MTDEDIRMETLKLAIQNTSPGTQWTAILTVAGRFAHFVSTGEDNHAGVADE